MTAMTVPLINFAPPPSGFVATWGRLRIYLELLLPVGLETVSEIVKLKITPLTLYIYDYLFFWSGVNSRQPLFTVLYLKPILAFHCH